MLLKLSDHIANCLERAAAAEQRAAEATTDAIRADNELMAKSWRQLATSYQFVETLERFLLDMDLAKRTLPPDFPDERQGKLF